MQSCSLAHKILDELFIFHAKRYAILNQTSFSLYNFDEIARSVIDSMACYSDIYSLIVD